jgi:hypothetical protein
LDSEDGGGGPDEFGPEVLPELRLADPDLFAEEIEVNLIGEVAPRPLMVPEEVKTSPPVSGLSFSSPASFFSRLVGRLHERVDFWLKKLEADTYVQNIVRSGYNIPVFPGTDKIVYREKNNPSARSESQFVTAEVYRLLEAGLVVRSDVRPLCTNPLSVAFKAQPDGTYKKRLVIDLSRHVNKLITKMSYKMTTIGDVLGQTFKGDFQYVFDLEAAYHHVRLHPDLYK